MLSIHQYNNDIDKHHGNHAKDELKDFPYLDLYSILKMTSINYCDPISHTK